MRTLLFIMLFLPFMALGQNKLEGKVIDETNGIGICNVTIYVNGTTIGTISDKEGYFILENVSLPCNIGFSHIKYEPSMIRVTNTEANNCTIILKPRNIQLKQVKISNNNRRTHNVYKFKANFLGQDYFGKQAKLLNDKDLFFTHDYKPKKIKIPKGVTFDRRPGKSFKIVHEKDGDYIIKSRAINTKVKASAPLIIDLPYLGYKIQTELINYIVEFNEDHSQTCSFLGYYYFQTYELKLRKYENRRKKAYYNSSLHFCRSLYNKELKKNGYQLLEVTGEKKNNTLKTKLISIDTLNTIKENNSIKLIGLKGKHFTILYNCKSNGSPIDLNTHRLKSGPQSIIYFNSDTCKINSNGIVSDNNILFSGKISKKKVGALLPENYYPKNN